MTREHKERVRLLDPDELASPYVLPGKGQKIVTCHFPPNIIRKMNSLVEHRGDFANRSELIRFAVLLLLREYEFRE